LTSFQERALLRPVEVVVDVVSQGALQGVHLSVNVVLLLSTPNKYITITKATYKTIFEKFSRRDVSAMAA